MKKRNQIWFDFLTFLILFFKNQIRDREFSQQRKRLLPILEAGTRSFMSLKVCCHWTKLKVWQVSCWIVRLPSFWSFLAPKPRSTSWIQDDLISRISNVATNIFSFKSLEQQSEDSKLKSGQWKVTKWVQFLTGSQSWNKDCLFEIFRS